MSKKHKTKLASWKLPDALWKMMEPLIPPRKSQEGRPRTVDLKRITEGIFYVLRTGIQCSGRLYPGNILAHRAPFITIFPNGSRQASFKGCGRRRWSSMVRKRCQEPLFE